MRKIIKCLVAAVLAGSSFTYFPVSAANKDVVCLAKVIYYEARGEPRKGKLAVAKVTLNRLNSGKFADTVCDVVYQPGQYSWVKKPQKIRDLKAWSESVELAKYAISTGVAELQHFPALYFHNVQVKPAWRKRRVVARIGRHIFYA